MSNRYANLVGSKKISEDFNNINIGFDRVQTDMDTKAAAASPVLTGTPTAPTQPAGDNSTKIATTQYADRSAGKVQGNLDTHISDKVVHVTQEDHDKLDGIQEGAEVNQNAFAKVNDIEAAAPSSQLFIVGGLGITVTTNPNTGEVTVTATGESAPGAHGSTHTEHGADPIPAATLTEGGLLSAAQFAEIVAHGELLDEHSAAITSLEDRLDTADTEELTLQPGVQIITAQRDARFKLGSIKGKSEINGQGRIGIIGVENPYVSRISGNLLPPFYEWRRVSGEVGLANVLSPYKIDLSKSGDGFNTIGFIVSAKPESDYRFSVSVDASNIGGTVSVGAYWNAFALDAKGEVLEDYTEGPFVGTNGTHVMGKIFKTPKNTASISVVMGIDNGTTGNFLFYDPIITNGTDQKPFALRKDSMLAFQTELHANSNDGSEKDELFERDGQYFKLGKWKKLIFDGSGKWSYVGSASGFKRLKLPVTDAVSSNGSNSWVTKYDGSQVPYGDSNTLPNAHHIIASQSGLFLSVPATDSGWGDNYTPTADEIKAYFMGWRMRPWNSTDPYDGTGDKAWASVISGGGSYWTSTLPTVPAPDWTPYNLLYKLATPTVESITSEGCLTLAEGNNQVEVGTGIVLREGVKAKNDAGPTFWYLNANNGLGYDAPFKYKVGSIKAIYKNSRLDTPRWILRPNNPAYYGGFGAYAVNANYDQSAAYSATYFKLDKSPIVPVTGSVATSEKAQLTDLTAGVQEALTRVSVVEQKKADKDAPGWIAPTLLNGWSTYNQAPSYLKDQNGFVHLKGRVSSGSTASGSIIFTLPPGFRPGELRKFIVSVYPGSGTTSSGALNINYADGTIAVDYLPGNGWVSLDNIIFLAEK